jgi:hypothetical protein
MRRFTVAAALALFAGVTLASSASAVPSFTRQTGLTCNQCHVTFSNVPDFTFTGKKFRLNGYRTPFVAEKIEAGEEGALNGNRLTMGIQNIFSLRFRNNLLSQSKPASDAAGPEAVKGGIISQPGTTISWFYVGTIADHIGLWNEFYLTNAGNVSGEAARFRIETFDEFDLKFTMNPGFDNIVGLAITTQQLSDLAGFGPFSSGTPNNMQRGGFGTAGAAYVNLAAYAFIKDRLLLVGGVQPGESNYNFSDGMNFQTVLGYALGNTDQNQLWVMATVKAGNDAIPVVTNWAINSDRASVWSDAIAGVSATRGNGTTGTPLGAYLPANTGDFVRSNAELTYGFIDKGPHSFTGAVGLSYTKETYDDGAEIKQSGTGIRVRYYYDRTYGVEWGTSKMLVNEFTDRRGVVHDTEKLLSSPLSVNLFYRPAMNFSLNLGFGINNTLGTRLDANRSIRNGWQWQLGYDFFF